MSLTASTFKARWPEFDATTNERITTALAVAATQVNAVLFTGELLDHLTGLLAAHALCVSPYGRPGKAKDSGRSAYLEEYERIARNKAGGPWLSGQRGDGTMPEVVTEE